MATEEYSIGYQDGRRDGWNAAMDSLPPQRTWVGLTDEEIYKTANDLFYGNGPCDTIAMFRATEAKLKEKNGG